MISLADAVALGNLSSADRVAGKTPMLVVDLDSDVPSLPLVVPSYAVLVGVMRQPPRPEAAVFAASMDLTLASQASDRWAITVPDIDTALAAIASSIEATPDAAATLASLLRLTASTGVRNGLTAESLAYSMLLAGPEFKRWLADRDPAPAPIVSGPAVLMDRAGARLTVTLNRPSRRNAYDRDVRDGLVEAFDLARLDDSIRHILLRGNGKSFCSGGDLGEFGTTPDIVTAHAVRSERSVAARIDAVRERVHAFLHGPCIGAGIELPSFAGRVSVHPDALFRLPELQMGLIPGAGGTVGITRRIGRWRCAYLALTGTYLDAATAHAWGLADEVRTEVH